MELTIEFANRYIEITEKKVSSGRIVIEKYVRGKMPEGAFQNGIVVNTNAVAIELRELMKQQQIRSKNAVLSISGMDIIRKEVAIPKSPEKQVRGLLENELKKTDVLKRGYLFDYIPDEDEITKEFQNYQVYMLPEDLVNNYRTTLKRAGITLARIVPIARSMEVMAGFKGLHKRKDLTIVVSAEASHINLLMTGDGIKSIHRMIEVKEEEGIEDNVFIVSAVRQIKNTISPEYQAIENLVENIFKLVQFQSQTYKGRNISEILIYGELTEEEGFIEELEKRCQIPVHKCRMETGKVTFSNSGIEADYHGYSSVCIGVRKEHGHKKELSFVNIPGSSSYVSAKDYMAAFIGLGCIFALAIFYCVVQFMNLRAENRIDELKTDIADIESQEIYQEKYKLEQDLNKLISYNESCKTCIDLIENKQRMEPELFAKVDKLAPENVSIQSYGYENHTAIFKCISAYQDGPADFAKIVTDAELFEEVKYTGFQAFADINGVTYYNFQLECRE